jgi:hypothetical protein
MPSMLQIGGRSQRMSEDSMRLFSPADEATRRMRQSIRPSPLQVREGGDPMRLSSPADEVTRRMRESVR